MGVIFLTPRVAITRTGAVSWLERALDSGSETVADFHLESSNPDASHPVPLAMGVIFFHGFPTETEADRCLEELLTPAPSLERQRALALMLHLATGPSEYPEFQVLYMHLGDEYMKLATEYFSSGYPDAARLAIEALGSILPKVAEPDRTRLRKSYQDLRKELQESKNKRK